MNKKQLIVGCITLVLIAIIPFVIWTIRSIAEEYSYFTVLEWLISGLPILIIGALLFYSLRDKKQTMPKPSGNIKDRIKRDRQLLLMFFLLWLASSAWNLQHKSAIINLDFSNIPLGQSIIMFVVGVVSLVIFIFSSIYIYKMYKWYNSPKAPALIMTIIYIISWFILPLIPILIGAGIIWKSRELLIDKQESIK